MLRQHIRCDAPSLSLADYNFIMQCRNNRPRSKVLNKLKEKYSISLVMQTARFSSARGLH